MTTEMAEQIIRMNMPKDIISPLVKEAYEMAFRALKSHKNTEKANSDDIEEYYEEMYGFRVEK